MQVHLLWSTAKTSKQTNETENTPPKKPSNLKGNYTISEGNPFTSFRAFTKLWRTAGTLRLEVLADATLYIFSPP